MFFEHSIWEGFRDMKRVGRPASQSLISKTSGIEFLQRSYVTTLFSHISCFFYDFASFSEVMDCILYLR